MIKKYIPLIIIIAIISGVLGATIYIGFSYENISAFFSQPLIVAIILAVFGKFFILDEILRQKIVDLKIDTIKKIVKLRNYIEKLKFLFDRMVRTLLVEKEEKHFINDPEEFNKEVYKEISKVSELINNTIPLLKIKLESEITFFYSDSQVSSDYKNYLEEIKKLSDFVVLKLPKHDKLFQQLSGDFIEFKLDILYETEKRLIESIEKAGTIYNKLKAK